MAAIAAWLLVGAVTAAAGGEAGLVTVNPDSAYPEGPVIDGGSVFYAEMGNDRVMRFDGSSNTVFWSWAGCGPTSVARGGGGTLLVLCHRRQVVVRVSADGETVT